MEFEYSFEKLGNVLDICITDDHKFGTDAFLLSNYANIKRKDLACDLGTGCGIIPMLWFRNPENAPKFAYAVDIQEKAIAQLNISIEKNNLQNKLKAICCDLKYISDSSLKLGDFDVVTCNPPYKICGSGIISEMDSEKIARHEVMCSINDVTDAAGKLLKFGGRLCICQRPERLLDVLEAMRNSKIEPKRIRFVQKLGNTAPWLFLVEGKKGAKPFLQVEKPFIIQDENGDFSDELKDVYFKF
ncbi:MAG: methyltransferase [Oscillospiraceae bacterium]